jgi:hypothetical protein
MIDRYEEASLIPSFDDLNRKFRLPETGVTAPCRARS